MTVMRLYRDKFRIESTRLKEWDYSSCGYYFVTICLKDKQCLFGEVQEGKIKFSEIGKVVQKCWLEIPAHFKNVGLDEFIVMPNHLHGIVIISNEYCRDAIHGVSKDKGGVTAEHNPMLSENSLSKIIRWFKGRSKFEINKIQDQPLFAWQSRFYEHIIRNEKSLKDIRKYIANNPIKWELDEYNPAK